MFVKLLKESMDDRKTKIDVSIGGDNGEEVKVKEEMMDDDMMIHDEAMGDVVSSEDEDEEVNFSGMDKALAIELSLKRKEKIKKKVEEGLNLKKGNSYTGEQASVDDNAFRAGVKRAEKLPTCYSLS